MACHGDCSSPDYAIPRSDPGAGPGWRSRAALPGFLAEMRLSSMGKNREPSSTFLPPPNARSSATANSSSNGGPRINVLPILTTPPMDGETYRDLLARIARARTRAELEALTECVRERGGVSPRRRALMHAIEERRRQLENE